MKGPQIVGVRSRLALTIGFGGLVLLIMFAGVDGIQTVEQIQNANSQMREDFVLRTRVLERIRADLYASGTFVRDYLLEPEGGRAEGHRYSLIESRKDMDAALEEYRKLLNAPERNSFAGLMDELTRYWKVLDPVFQWDAARRQEKGYPFLRDEVFPRRVSILAIADQIRQIDEAQLSSGKAALEQSFLGFRRRLKLTIAVTIALGLLLAFLAIRRILVLEGETAVHYAAMSDTKTELQQLSARLVEAQEDERRSIARELHDQVGQALTGVLVEMANLSTLIRSADPGAQTKAGEIKRLLEDSIGTVRNMSLLLRPSMLDDLGLVPALQWQAREVSKRGSVRVKVSAEDVSEELPEAHKTCIYRIVQEALHNVQQHAAARNVNIDVRQDAGGLSLLIQDDGRGFNAAQERGMGLLGIQERVSNLNGIFAVDSVPGEGTALRVKLPIRVPSPNGNGAANT